MVINKNTRVFISIAKTAGNFGCAIHNAAFRYHGLNCIYKPFSVEDLESAIAGIKAFGISGCGITMPYKMEVLPYLDLITPEVRATGSCNTIVNENGKLTGHNTDVISTYKVLSRHMDKHKESIILGNGGFSKAVQHSARCLGFPFRLITRGNWHEIQNIKQGLVFNCTPTVNDLGPEVDYIDCLVSTKTGKELALLQAAKQFELYVGKDFPLNYLSENLDSLLTQVEVGG